MRNAHRRIGRIDVLPPRARRTVGIHPQVGRVDIDLDVVINLGGDKNRSKRGVTAPTAIKRRLSYEAMHPCLGAQPSEGVLPFKLHRRTLQAGHLTSRRLDQRRLEPLVFTPSQIHSQQHLSPILRLGASRAGLNIQISIILVRLAREHSSEFQFFQRTFERRQILLDRLSCILVVFLHGEVKQITGVITSRIESFNGGHHGLEGGPFST